MRVNLIRLTLVMVMALALNASVAQVRTQAAPAVGDVVIHFGCDVSGCTYDPSVVLIEPGQTVEWDGDFMTHPLVSDDVLWITNTVGTVFTHTYTMTGTFLFHCAVHGGYGGVGMSGRVIVANLQHIYLPLVLK